VSVATPVGALLSFTIVLYLLSSLAPVPTLLRREQRGTLLAPAFAGAGLIAHMSAIVLGGIAAGRCPVVNRYEIMSLLSWLIVLFYLIVYARSRMQVLTVILPPLSLVVLVTSNLLDFLLPEGPLPLTAAQQGTLFVLHVTIAVLSVAALCLTFALSAIYVLQDRLLKNKQHGSWLRVLPPLDRCDRLVYRSLILGFPLLTLGIVSGSVLHATRSGHFWAWRGDELFALVAWSILAVVIVARLTRGWRGRRSAYLTIAGFVAGVLTMVSMYL